MKFSVLLPTRNRLALLRYAVESVRRQDYNDWEIIVSDNFSGEDIGGYVRELGDPRIKHFRTEKSVPVTDNWNNALEHCNGDYVIMLGDDDCLMPGYFIKVRQLAEAHGNPDLIYSSGYVYAYPGVMPSQPEGYLHPSGCAKFLRRSKDPFFLDQTTARQMVGHSLNFELRFDYNMQYSTVSRRMIETLRKHGPFFQSPFPDFYATNALFLKADRILVCPQGLVIIGISPKSYGFYHFNQQEKTGVAFLQCLPDAESARRLAQLELPGSNMNTSWLYSMETLKANFGAEFGLEVNHERYRALQIVNYHLDVLGRKLASSEKQDMRRRLQWQERVSYGGKIGLARLLGRKAVRKLLHKWVKRFGQYPDDWQVEFIPQQCKNILEASSFLADRQIKPENASAGL